MNFPLEFIAMRRTLGSLMEDKTSPSSDMEALKERFLILSQQASYLEVTAKAASLDPSVRTFEAALEDLARVSAAVSLLLSRGGFAHPPTNDQVRNALNALKEASKLNK